MYIRMYLYSYLNWHENCRFITNISSVNTDRLGVSQTRSNFWRASGPTASKHCCCCCCCQFNPQIESDVYLLQMWCLMWTATDKSRWKTMALWAKIIWYLFNGCTEAVVCDRGTDTSRWRRVLAASRTTMIRMNGEHNSHVDTPSVGSNTAA